MKTRSLCGRFPLESVPLNEFDQLEQRIGRMFEAEQAQACILQRVLDRAGLLRPV